MIGSLSTKCCEDLRSSQGGDPNMYLVAEGLAT